MNYTVYTWKDSNEWVASCKEKPFDGISGIGDTELEAMKEFFIAMVGAVIVEIEDANKKELLKDIPIYPGHLNITLEVNGKL